MAKKKKKKSQPRGVTFTSEVLRHTNAQTFGADSTTAIGEAIATPGYSEQGMSGCYIVGAQISHEFTAGIGLLAANQQMCCQLQSGERDATPAILNPDDVGFFAQRSVQTVLAGTDGLAMTEWPKPMSISMPVPIIVMPMLTIVWDTTVNNAAFANDEFFCEIYYRTVKLAATAYSSLLLQQQRTS